MVQKRYSIKIHGIDIIEKSIFKTKVLEGDVFNFEVKTQTVPDSLQHLIITFISVQVTRIHTTDIFARLLVGIGYLLENFEETIENDEEGKYMIPPDLEGTLKQISISTIRGIMFSEFRGTQLHGAVLPIILSDSFAPVEGNLVEE